MSGTEDEKLDLDRLDEINEDLRAILQKHLNRDADKTGEILLSLALVMAAFAFPSASDKESVELVKKIMKVVADYAVEIEEAKNNEDLQV